MGERGPGRGEASNPVRKCNELRTHPTTLTEANIAMVCSYEVM